MAIGNRYRIHWRASRHGLQWLLVEAVALAYRAASYGVMFAVLLAAAAPAPEVKGSSTR